MKSYIFEGLRGLDSGLDSGLDLTPGLEINFTLLLPRSANLHFVENALKIMISGVKIAVYP